MAKRGIDLGNHGLKDDLRNYIPSKITTKDRLLSDSKRFVFQGELRILGEGEYQTDYNKAFKENVLVSLFGMIAIGTEDIMNQVVIGLPIQHYKAQKEHLKQLVMDNRIQDVEYNCKPRKIVITDIEVAPEGVSAFHSLNEEKLKAIGEQDVVIVDIGGRTTDICLYNMVYGQRKIEEYQTLPVGMLNIYDDFIRAINSTFTLDKTLEDGEKIMKSGLVLYGQQQDLSFTKPILKEHIDKIFKELNMNFPVSTSQVVLVGGGSIVLHALFKKRLPHVILSNEPVFGNAIGFKKICESLFKD